MNSRRKLGFVAAAAIVASLAGAGMATADPVGDPPHRSLAGVGSDTTQDVMNGVAEAVTVNGTKVVGSYDAIGSPTIKTKAAGCEMNRPNGSNAGRAALVNSLSAADNCLQWARSSSLNLAATRPEAQLTYVPFAVDGMTYAVSENSDLPRQLTFAEVRSIYRCDPDVVGTGPNYNFKIYLPQAGSGTRQFWLGRMGITEAQLAAGEFPCVKDRDDAGRPVQEHDGAPIRAGGATAIAPFSIAQYIAQVTGTTADRRDEVVLGTIDGQAPFTLNGDRGANNRTVYTIVPTAKEADPAYRGVFTKDAAGRAVACADGVIKRYGFAPHAQCGDVLPSNRTPVAGR
jgi:ABC-type phosphate transport system substrate-binding protein